MYQNDPAKVLTGEVRLSYVHLIEPRTSKPGDDPKYSVTLLIPKTDFVTKADIDASIRAAAQDAVGRVWNGAAPPQLSVPIYDGDGVCRSGEPFGEECNAELPPDAEKVQPLGVRGDALKFGILAQLAGNIEIDKFLRSIAVEIIRQDDFRHDLRLLLGKRKSTIFQSCFLSGVNLCHIGFILR